jgi:hypothetical protein
MQRKSHQVQDFVRTQMVLQARVLGNEAQPAAGLRLAHVAGENLALPASDACTDQDLDQRAFASAVGADETEGFASVDGQRDALQRFLRRLSPAAWVGLVESPRLQIAWLMAPSPTRPALPGTTAPCLRLSMT